MCVSGVEESPKGRKRHLGLATNKHRMNATHLSTALLWSRQLSNMALHIERRDGAHVPTQQVCRQLASRWPNTPPRQSQGVRLRPKKTNPGNHRTTKPIHFQHKRAPLSAFRHASKYIGAISKAQQAYRATGETCRKCGERRSLEERPTITAKLCRIWNLGGEDTDRAVNRRQWRLNRCRGSTVQRLSEGKGHPREAEPCARQGRSTGETQHFTVRSLQLAG